MEYDPLVDLPGGDNFHDVTALFEDAAEALHPGALVLTNGFTLLDAMSSFEIGEPRFDSGLALLDKSKPIFNPLAPLTPEEVCWIIDRSFSCEMEWHSGYTLSQTIYSFLYVHSLKEIDPDLVPGGSPPRSDNLRPPELITVVLRAALLGLLKCCDLSWRELNKGNVYDAEDWQSEKCDVPLSEALPVKYICKVLDEACHWLETSAKVQQPWKAMLMNRLMLRKSLIVLFETQLSQPHSSLLPTMINLSLQLLHPIMTVTPSEPALDSPARLAFDPQFPRVIVSYIPLHVIQLPDQARTWALLEGMLTSLKNVNDLANTTELTTWEVAGHLQLWCPRPHSRFPYVRSITQSAFWDGVLVLNKFALKHVVDQFFRETLNISYDAFTQDIMTRWEGPAPPPLAQIERTMTQILIANIKSLWYNLPRRRRFCAKSLFDWHELFVVFMDVCVRLAPLQDQKKLDHVRRARVAVLMYRLSVIREVVLSGFQLSLYTNEERVFAYWYVVQVLEMHLSCIDQLMPGMSSDSNAYFELSYQLQFLTALQSLSMTVFAITVKKTTFSWRRTRLNFLRRYKWAFMPEYEDIDLQPIGHPSFTKFATACESMQKDKQFSLDSIALAIEVLSRLLTSPDGWAGRWSEERKKFVQKLLDVCIDLQRQLPSTEQALTTWDAKTLKWDADVHPWFPIISGFPPAPPR
ncbi:Mak10 subunit, NatC N-terminal acetyltransferase-domain-containing protein [Suillus subalutaceus]|uniref:Mak10 subunit, NatC N-terminal acetyltransferase-domain-containing protein n=1 Tax=Suillus subalutaceus TaxID=48586 RepID=UPI001B8782AB|nr:Mak10 subunit, NatC N-terminal acetyltransferase-domain-containing protein [Suillus subalutaceus]KAG1856630.1 Mak10 subunit, NatC N-terminal acetyltransferase-domain-containing protein [Suillus subalutaceus]